MNLRRLSNIATPHRLTLFAAGSALVWLAVFGPPRIEPTGARPATERQDASLPAQALPAQALSAPPLPAQALPAEDHHAQDQPAQEVHAQEPRADDQRLATIADAAADFAALPTTAEFAAAKAAEPRAAADKPEPALQLASAEPSDVLPGEPPSLSRTAQGPAEPVAEPATQNLDTAEVLDECFVADACVDRYLWALYRRAPKEDTIKVPEQTSVTVKRKGKMVTVKRTVTKLVDEDFAWKDPKAAEKAGMPMSDYVIGGMDRKFKLKLFHALYAAEMAGFAPGITSAFRDDYRQSIASGLKAASNRSFHGGSLRGGYGHGLAADVVSITGGTRDERWASSEKLWKWIDAHSSDFGIGRPYHGYDPAHFAPTDGAEYVSRSGRSTARHAGADLKKRKQTATGHPRGAVKPKVARL